MRICITGGSGFIGSHLAKELLNQGHYIIVADWKRNEYFDEKEFCSEFLLLDLRILSNCVKATKDCEWVFNMAADMGGMGYIQSNHSVIMFNNLSLTINILEACRRNKVERLLYASSACVYPEYKQNVENSSPLKENEAWPAQPQDGYGLEKLVGEEIGTHYSKDFNLEIRIVRYHNIYGPYGTWKGGREKAPAAFCRKIICTNNGDTIEMWGDGKQTRSFCYIDDCIKGTLKVMNSSYDKPINIGSSEMISMNDMHSLICDFENKNIYIKHISGPEGVRGRCSDNTLIKQILEWEPSISLKEGLNKLYFWIKDQIQDERKNGTNIINYKKSEIIIENSNVLDEVN